MFNWLLHIDASSFHWLKDIMNITFNVCMNPHSSIQCVWDDVLLPLSIALQSSVMCYIMKYFVELHCWWQFSNMCIIEKKTSIKIHITLKKAVYFVVFNSVTLWLVLNKNLHYVHGCKSRSEDSSISYVPDICHLEFSYHHRQSYVTVWSNNVE